MSSYNEQHRFVDRVFIDKLRQKISSNNTTGTKGVSFRRQKNGLLKYVVNIDVLKERYYILARKKAEDKYHKPYLDKFT